jgi:hypothetical protein
LKVNICALPYLNNIGSEWHFKSAKYYATRCLQMAIF